MPSTPLTIRMHAHDNVAIVANDGGLDAGTVLLDDFAAGLTLVDRVPQGHKVALADIATGAPVLRYGIPYGPRMRETTVMSAFFRKALSGEALTIDGDGMQSRNFVYVEDLAAAHVLALDPKAENQVINVDGPVPVTIRQVAETTAELVGDVEVSFGPSRPGDLKPQVVRNDKALDVLGWKPEVDIADGMRRAGHAADLHIALGVEDVYAACERIRAAGGTITREAGPMKHGTTVIAFVRDPDGYSIELIDVGSRGPR